MQQQQRKGASAFKYGAILLVLPALLSTVASVPTSVLVQNSELSATNNDIASLNSLKLKNNPMNKVKRSSGNSHDAAQLLSTSTTSTESANNNGLEKKSSPEVVPALYNAPPRPNQNVNALPYDLPENPQLINTAIAAGLTAAAVEAAATAHQRNMDQPQVYEEQEAPTLLHKRGISAAQQQAYSYGNDDGYYTNPFLNSVLSSSSQLPSDGVWADELDPVATYSDVQELDDYIPMQRAPSYHNKAYDNLQNLLNAEVYLEPVALPYSSRYYGADRKKRAYPNKYNPKRDAKLTPADMLALVALVEAGERARKEPEPENPSPMYTAADSLPTRNYFGNNVGLYDYPAAAQLDDDAGIDFNLDNTAALYEPPSVVDYYGTAMNMEALPKYELTAPREHRYPGRNRLAAKRFMVAKKNRLLGKFLNEPVAQPSISYNTNDDNYF